MGSFRRGFLVVLPAVLAVSGACTRYGEDKTPTQPSTAHIELTITPSPIPVQIKCPAPTNPDYCLASLSPTITVAETAGLGGRIDSVEVILRNVTLGRDESKVTLGSDWLARQAGTNRIEAMAKVAFRPVVSDYPIPASGPRPQLRLVLGVQFTDDRGNVLFQSVQADLAP